ncbi:hypothetical protein DFQ14_12116 [Halopolyspora algeriensis]|uniref:Uncharacterized protein n=1 Tax=Halopolyspora algeriensis TaxID=1500506 RepID=A0A368VFR8_9ACTN|nr:hypothetical protein DFQ14_12116 [Halopolyspora algeriensis]TQM42595.1 hypothetical protein FHU43_4230 [Halopolyspora algeriensis]
MGARVSFSRRAPRRSTRDHGVPAAPHCCGNRPERRKDYITALRACGADVETGPIFHRIVIDPRIPWIRCVGTRRPARTGWCERESLSEEIRCSAQPRNPIVDVQPPVRAQHHCRVRRIGKRAPTDVWHPIEVALERIKMLLSLIRVRIWCSSFENESPDACGSASTGRPVPRSSPAKSGGVLTKVGRRDHPAAHGRNGASFRTAGGGRSRGAGGAGRS